MDNCSATERVASKMFVCELPLRHKGSHREGDFSWKGEDVRDNRKFMGPSGEERE